LFVVAQVEVDLERIPFVRQTDGEPHGVREARSADERLLSGPPVRVKHFAVGPRPCRRRVDGRSVVANAAYRAVSLQTIGDAHRPVAERREHLRKKELLVLPFGLDEAKALAVAARRNARNPAVAERPRIVGVIKLDLSELERFEVDEAERGMIPLQIIEIPQNHRAFRRRPHRRGPDSRRAHFQRCRLFEFAGIQAKSRNRSLPRIDHDETRAAGGHEAVRGRNVDIVRRGRRGDVEQSDLLLRRERQEQVLPVASADHLRRRVR
jgi:hypothetical protein